MMILMNKKIKIKFAELLDICMQGEIFQGCLTHFSLCATIHGKAMKETIVYAVTLRQGEASWTASVLRKR